MTRCKYEDCTVEKFKRGLCSKHYYHWWIAQPGSRERKNKNNLKYMKTYKHPRAGTSEFIQKQRDWRNKDTQKHKGRTLAAARTRKLKKAQAVPPWLSTEQKKQIYEMYKLAKELNWLSEEPLHVDHIIPIRGKNVSGLHVPWNLQIIPRSWNIKKGNRVDV